MADGLLEGLGLLQMFTNANASMVTGEGISEVNGVPSSCAERLFSRLRLQLCREEQLQRAQLRQSFASIILPLVLSFWSVRN